MFPFFMNRLMYWRTVNNVESIKAEVVVEKKLADIEQWEPSDY